MGLLSAKQDEEVMAEINITPFTDVLLVLLIIFMILAALVTPPGFEKQLSNSSNTPTKKQNKQSIEVLVNSRGVIFVDGQKTDEAGVYNVMAQVRAKRGDKPVEIAADAKSPYGILIRVLDAAKIAGLDDVNFETE